MHGVGTMGGSGGWSPHKFIAMGALIGWSPHNIIGTLCVDDERACSVPVTTTLTPMVTTCI
jgi:hypothetical protein